MNYSNSMIAKENWLIPGRVLLCPKTWKNGSKTRFFEFIEKFDCVPAKIPYLRGFFSRDMGQNVLRQSDFKIFNQPYLRNKSMK